MMKITFRWCSSQIINLKAKHGFYFDNFLFCSQSHFYLKKKRERRVYMNKTVTPYNYIVNFVHNTKRLSISLAF